MGSNQGVPCQMGSLQKLIWDPAKQEWTWLLCGDVSAWQYELQYTMWDSASSVWNNLQAWGWVS